MRKLALVIAALAACNSSSSAPRASAASGPLEVDWGNEYGMQKFHVKGGGEGTVRGSGTKLSVSLEKFEKGTQYQLGGEKGTVDHYASVEVDVRDKLGALMIDQLEKVATDLTLDLTTPDGRHASLKIPPVSFKLALVDALKKAENGPVLFGKEPEDPNPSDSLAYLGGLSMEMFGRAGTLSQIDFVATQDKLPDEKGHKVCKGYKDSAGKPMADLTIRFKDTKVTIWNRRTGDKVEEKTFPADDECPMFAMHAKDENAMDSYAPTSKIQAWLKTRVKR